ncbi:hyaluronidase-1 [Thalassophryne amazonica]|uniref:hyaluronidase-1 n=1 Tax=Thalassophryne amazonica TaxID=390379 RepID=UPI0014718815|nr:hyaluronidase-1 [Thalassophryne amazonica]
MWLVQPEQLLFLYVIGLVSGLSPAASPFLQAPFRAVWNAPTANCLSLYSINLDTETLGMVYNKNQELMGGNITLFYSGELGLYPSYSSQWVAVNGGVPQNASLDTHLKVASENIQASIPDEDFSGLAVIDWESWRPIWERNWGSKQVYKEGSEALVRAKHRDWSPAQIQAVARTEFEEAAKKFMEQTVRLGQKERANGLWGYYGFPECYNYYDDKKTGYTGQCPAVEMKRNNELFWLWNTSSALYPDIYLSLNLRGLSKEVLMFVQHRILEAMRVSAQVTPVEPPVFPYARIVYTYTLDFLSQEHLIYTIGESAALGSAGIVLWGDLSFSKTKATCETVKSYIDETLGPYVANVTSAAMLCSQALCSSNGRCQRRNLNSKAYLHLNPAVWKVTREKKPDGGRNYRVVGQMKIRDIMFMNSQFQCKCYPGWSGKNCSKVQKKSKKKPQRAKIPLAV